MFLGGGREGGAFFSIFCQYVVVIGGDNMAWIIQHEENEMIDFARLMNFFSNVSSLYFNVSNMKILIKFKLFKVYHQWQSKGNLECNP
jgi:hypothetical protein